MGSHLCQKVSIASDKTQSLVLKYRSIASDKNSIVGVMPPNDFLVSLVTQGSIKMKQLPVIGSLCLRKDFWDRHGANIATRQKEIYGERLFRRPKKRFWCLIIVLLPLFCPKWVWVIFTEKGSARFCLNNREICSEIQRFTFLHAKGFSEIDIA